MNPTERTALESVRKEKRKKKKKNERTHQIAMWDGNTEGEGRGGGGRRKGVLNFWCGGWRGCNDEKVQGLRSSGGFREVVASGRESGSTLFLAGISSRLGLDPLFLAPPRPRPQLSNQRPSKSYNQPSHFSPDPPPPERPLNYHVRPIFTTTINILTPRIETTTKVTRVKKAEPLWT